MTRRILALALAAVVATAGLGLAGCGRLKSGGPGSAKKQTEVKLKIVAEAVPLGLERQFHVGETVRMKETGSVVGKIASIATTASLDTVATAEGGLVATPVPDEQDIILELDASAVAGEDGYRFDGAGLWVNQEAKLISPYVAFDGTVISIEETGK